MIRVKLSKSLPILAAALLATAPAIALADDLPGGADPTGLAAVGVASDIVKIIDKLTGPEPLDTSSLQQVFSNTGGINDSVLGVQMLNAQNHDNVIGGNINSGDVIVSDGALSGFAGVGNVVMNTGSQNNLQGAINIIIVTPGQ